MTKSPQSATTKLQLTNLFRWLAILCFIKLAIFTMILLDVPFPSLLDKTVASFEKETPNEKKPSSLPIKDQEMAIAPVGLSNEPTEKTEENKGSDAPVQQELIKPVIPAHDIRIKHKSEGTLLTAITEQKQTDPVLLKTSDLPLPPPLPAPIAEPGKEAPKETLLCQADVPVPTLGSVTAAQAAQSMPIPKAGPSTSPFAPMEQKAPLTQPGVPDIPRDDLGKRQESPQRGEMPLPQGYSATQRMPTPQTARPMPQAPMPGNTGPQPTNSMQLNTEAQDLARQQQDMLMLKKQMDERMKELQDSENKVKRMLEEARDMEDKKIRALIQMYANMKPKTAAKALESMDERTACQILQRMTPKQSGDILSYTNPTVTAKLTELLARMRIQ
ncbi:MAG: hypothetical protein J5803_02415 [Desulfovibrio sp.]|nr:hypothetical protein [Desulfovibrio sp.]